MTQSLSAVGLAGTRTPRLLSEITAPARSFAVALALNCVGKKIPAMRFTEMIEAANTYLDQLGWPNYSREESRNCLELLMNYALVLGGPSAFARRQDLDEVAPPTH